MSIIIRQTVVMSSSVGATIGLSAHETWRWSSFARRLGGWLAPSPRLSNTTRSNTRSITRPAAESGLASILLSGADSHGFQIPSHQRRLRKPPCGKSARNLRPSGQDQAPPLRLWNRIAELLGGIDPEANCILCVAERGFLDGAVRHTPRKFRHLRDERPVFVAPIDNDFVFDHGLEPGFAFRITDRTGAVLRALGCCKTEIID